MATLEIPHTRELPPITPGKCSLEAIFDKPDIASQARAHMSGMDELEISEEEEIVFRSVGELGLKVSAIRYGSGSPDSVQDPDEIYTLYGPRRKPLWYNHARHNYNVGEAGGQLSHARGLGSLACESSRIAGNCHDENQDGVIGGNRDGRDELRSAQELVDVLEGKIARANTGTEKEHLEKASLWGAYFIMGTRVAIGANGEIEQFGTKVDKHDLPCLEAWRACQIGACSDFGQLYNSFDDGFGLIPQRSGLSYPEVPDLRNEATRFVVQGFVESQIPLLGNFKYCLPEAEALFAPKRKQVVDHMIDLLKICKDGGLEDDWHTFIEGQRQAKAMILAA